MKDEIILIKEVVARLGHAGIEYMLTGSLAMTIYTAPRMTRDVDMVVQLNVEDVGRLVALFQHDFYIDGPSVREAIIHRRMFNIIHDDSAVKIDFIVLKDQEYRLTEFARRRMVDLDGVGIKVVAPEDLILSKLVWAKSSRSELQLRDVRQLLMVKSLDVAYMDHWADTLGVASLLTEVRKSA